MSTRGAIARPSDRHEGAFEGRYHHWDSYPSGLGKTLFEVRNGHFAGDTARMLATLIDAHPAGWSTINGTDFRLAPGYLDLTNRSAVARPQCYCHGDRRDEGWLVTDENAAASGVEWAYVLDGSVMHVLASRNDDGTKMIGIAGYGNPNAKWIGVARVDLDGDPPDWDSVTTARS